MPSMSRKLVLSLGSIAAILLLSGVISILEYRRMSNYVSELIAADINSDGKITASDARLILRKAAKLD